VDADAGHDLAPRTFGDGGGRTDTLASQSLRDEECPLDLDMLVVHLGHQCEDNDAVTPQAVRPTFGLQTRVPAELTASAPPYLNVD
jgi:hypothetical protein